ncbi:MAG: SUKH-3 domain-containing protein [Sphingobacteriales bacterium]|nr:SUKH-3 domain-containing protein [Sphingobacteriales bacterium]
MEFSNEAKSLLIQMGWQASRKIPIADLKLPYSDYPSTIIDFLQEYGDIEGYCEKQDYTEVVNELILYPELGESELTGDNTYPYYQSIIGRKLYPLGLYLPDGYYVCCDAEGRVYKIGEYCFYVGKNLYEGIENILFMNTLLSLQLDEDTGKWWNMDAQYVELP